MVRVEKESSFTTIAGKYTAYSLTYLSARGTRTASEILVAPNGAIRVVSNNASHRAWRGLGNRFDSFESAIDKYKSTAMKEMLSAANALYVTKKETV